MNPSELYEKCEEFIDRLAREVEIEAAADRERRKKFAAEHGVGDGNRKQKVTDELVVEAIRLGGRLLVDIARSLDSIAEGVGV